MEIHIMSIYKFKTSRELRDFLNFHLSVERGNVKVTIFIFAKDADCSSDLALGEVVKYQKGGMFFWLNETDTMLFPCDEFNLNVLDASTGCEVKYPVSDFQFELIEQSKKS